MRRIMAFALVVPLVIFLVACEGDQGPIGPQGLQGEQGDQGEQGEDGPPGDPGPGTRIVYKSVTAIDADSTTFTIAIPEITLENLPAVDVYVSDLVEPVEWYEIPRTWIDPPLTRTYTLTEGHVTLINCESLHYMIIIII